ILFGLPIRAMIGARAMLKYSGSARPVYDQHHCGKIIMKKPGLRPLLLSLAVTTPATAQNVNVPANQRPSDTVHEEIIVTGSYRDSLANALELKREAGGFVDAIMAEDIADFPDN